MGGPPWLKFWRNRSSCQRVRKIIKEKQVLLRLTSKFLWRSSYNMQKCSHLVCGMFMLVGAEKKIWRNDMLGPDKKRWLTPAMHVAQIRKHVWSQRHERQSAQSGSYYQNCPWSRPQWLWAAFHMNAQKPSTPWANKLLCTPQILGFFCFVFFQSDQNITWSKRNSEIAIVLIQQTRVSSMSVIYKNRR